MRLINANKLIKAIENENPGISISGAEEKYARIFQVNMQPTVEAIPIEFIEKQIDKTTDFSNKDELDLWYAGHLRHLIKLWENENGKN